MAEDHRLLDRAIEAFVGRAPIDWNSLSRIANSEDRASFVHLRFLAALRDTGRIERDVGPRRPWAARTALALFGLSICQTIIALGLVAAAVTAGASTNGRSSEVVLASAFAAAGLLLGATAFRDPRSVFLSAAFATAASAFARGAALAVAHSWAMPFLTLIPEALTPACFWEFALDFPRVLRFTRFDLFARRAANTAWAVGLLMFGVNMVSRTITAPRSSSTFALLLRFDHRLMFWHLFSFSAVTAIGVIVARSRRAPYSERRRLTRLAMAIAVGTGPYLLLEITRTAIPALDYWFVTSKTPARNGLYQVVAAGFALTPIGSAIAILTDRPFVNQAPLWHALGTVRKRFGLWSRRLRNGGGVEGQDHLSRTLARIRNARGQREIFGVLGRELSRAIGARGTLVVPTTDLSSDLPPFSRDAALGEVLRKTSDPLDLSPDGGLLALLPEEDRDWLLGEDVTLACGVRYRDGTLAGIAALRRKRNGLSFGPLELWLVTSLTSAAGAACDALRSSGKLTPFETDGASVDEVAFECPRCGVVSASKVIGCGCRTDPILAGLPLHLAGKFIVSRRLGAGGMGVVYLARDTTLGREVALKTLPALDPAAAGRLHQEARAMAAIGHESLATIYGLETWRGTPVLVVEYFPFGTLADAIRKGPLPTIEVVRLGIELARALDHMHGHGMLHRDIKPSNIAFTSGGTSKLLDFGLASLASPSWVGETSTRALGPGRESDASKLGRIVAAGTRGYLPPEALGARSASPGFDLWALSVTLLEATIGFNPFIGRRSRRAFVRTDAPEKRTARICSQRFAHQPALARFFKRALTRDPAQRYKSGAEVQAALEEAMSCER